MKFLPDDLTVLYAKAKAYIANETEITFRNEVINALDEHADEDLYDRFYTSLAFGTAGMRGVIGGGTNRINVHMVRKVTQGLADYINEATDKPSVVIAFDSRNWSQVFAEEAALVLCANNIKVFLYDEIHPVPMLSFAVRRVGASAGIVITASHNPAKYNGYKVYWSDGGQVTFPHDDKISKKVASVQSEQIKGMCKEEATERKLLFSVPQNVDEDYYAMVLSSLRRPQLIQGNDVRVAYTPLHGTGTIPIKTLMHRLHVDIAVVGQQEAPDGDFPTVSMPNPEDPQAMRLAIELAKEQKSDIVLGTDPDADRLGIAIPIDATKSSYRLLTGNQIAILLCDYLITTWKEQATDYKIKPTVVKSLVTTDLVREIARRNGAKCIDVLTGFKYIAEQMNLLEHDSDRFFLFGCEESFGYLSIPTIRDKDAVSSALCAVEMMCYHAQQGKSLQERLDEIYMKYGYYGEKVLSYSYEGSAGKDKMTSIMANFRTLKAGDTFAGHSILKIKDLAAGEDGQDFPLSDVIVLWFEKGEKLIVRPSGTEPKIKYYLFFTIPYEERDQFDVILAERIARFKSAL